MKLKTKDRLLLATIYLFFSLISLNAYSEIILDDEIIMSVQKIIDPILEENKINPSAMEITIINSNQVNAFTTGGNRIFLFSGLIMNVDEASSLAGVIAHEFGHIKLGHIARMNDKSKNAIDIETISIAILSSLAAIALQEPTLATIGLTPFASNLLQFSRAQENAADRVAIQLIENSPYSLDGLIKVFKEFNKMLSNRNNQLIQYYNTHPLPIDRIEKIMHHKNSAKHKAQNENILSKNQILERAQIKLFAMNNDPDKTISKFKKEETFNEMYALAIAYLKKGNSEKSMLLIDKLIEKEPNNPFLYEIKSNIQKKNNNEEESIKNISIAHKLMNKNSSTITMQYATSILNSNLTTEKEKIKILKFLQRVYQKNKNSYTILYTLALAYEKNSDMPMSHLALAEMHCALGNKKMAKKHIEFARSMAANNIKNYERKIDEIESIMRSI